MNETIFENRNSEGGSSKMALAQLRFRLPNSYFRIAEMLLD